MQGEPRGNSPPYRLLRDDAELRRNWNLAQAPKDVEYGRVAGGSLSKRRTDLVPGPRDRKALWRRVGAFIRARRKELGLTSGDITRSLGYKNLLCDASHKRFHVTGSIM